MKAHARFVTFTAALTAALVSPAQIFTEESLAGATLGAIAGGIIGNNSRHSNTWEGAAIGAGAGLVLGSILGEARRESAWMDTQVPRPTRGWRYGRPDYSYYPWPQSPVRDWRPSAAARGAILGGIAGGIIGNNSRHSNTWEGVAIGAGSGFLLGSILDEAQRRRDTVETVTVPQTRQWPQGSLFGPGGSLPDSSGAVLIHNDSSRGGLMAPANALFGR